MGEQEYRYSYLKSENIIGLEDTNENEDDYSQWNYMDIIQWIERLDNGLFLPYKDRLQNALREEKVKGKHLAVVDKVDIKLWGITDFEHRRTLLQHIQSLVNAEGK